MSVGKLESAGQVLISLLKQEGECINYFLMQRDVAESEMICWMSAVWLQYEATKQKKKTGEQRLTKDNR